jgi:hypothetical protein
MALKMNPETSLLFSGGIDSMYAAIHLSKKCKRVHLLNFSNGYGHFFFGIPQKRYVELKKKAGNCFVYHHASIKQLFEKVLITNLHSDMIKYSSGFIWCLSCKLCMHAEAIIYDKLSNIKNTSDGSSYETKEMVEQTPFSLSLIMGLYESHGIKFKPTAYLMKRKDKTEMLHKMGIKTGFFFLNRNLGIQPKCIPGEIYYSPFIFMGRLPLHQQREISRFYHDKLQIINEHIKEKTRS